MTKSHLSAIALGLAVLGLATACTGTVLEPAPSLSPQPAATQPPATAVTTSPATELEHEVSIAPTPRPESTTIETLNGTMRMELPTGWSVADSSYSGPTLDGREDWSNILILTDPAGEISLRYQDGHLDDVRGTPEWAGIFERRLLSNGFSTTWWIRDASGRFIPGAGLTGYGYGGSEMLEVPNGRRLHSLAAQGSVFDEGFATQTEVEAFLGSAEVEDILAIIATVELVPVDRYAMP